MNARNLIATLAAVFALSTAAVGHAEEAAGGPPKQVKDLYGLVGKWSGTGTYKTDGQSFPIKVSYRCAKGSGGMAVKCHFRMTGIPNFTYEFDDLWGYSSNDGLIHWYTVTNAGETHDHAGHIDDKGIVVQYAGPSDGKAFLESIRFTREGKRKTKVEWTVTVGGTEKESGHFTLVK